MSKKNASDALDKLQYFIGRSGLNQIVALIGVLVVGASAIYLNSTEVVAEEARENGEEEEETQQTNGAKSATNYCGLENLGNTCYMNSLI